MLPRLTRPFFRHWSEIPLAIGLLAFAVYLAAYCWHCWVIIQHCGGFWACLHDFVFCH